jgi:hypothetical protein
MLAFGDQNKKSIKINIKYYKDQVICQLYFLLLAPEPPQSQGKLENIL